MHEEIDPALNDLFCLGFNEFLKIAKVRSFERSLTRDVTKHDVHDASVLADDLRLALASGVTTMDVNRFMLVRVKVNDDAEVFVKLGHWSLWTRRDFHLIRWPGTPATRFVGCAFRDEFVLELPDKTLHRPGAGFAEGANGSPAGNVVRDAKQVVRVALAAFPVREA